MDFMESGSLWDLLPRTNKAGQRPFQFQNRCGAAEWPDAIDLLKTCCSVLQATSCVNQSQARSFCRGKKIAYEVALGLHFIHELK